VKETPVYPAPIENYTAPATLAEALQALAHHGEDARCIAGGQSLMQAVRSRLVRPKCLVDLQHIAELKGVTVDANGVRIGAMTRYRDIAADARLNGAYQALVDAASHVGDRQVRNRGTIGGSLCWNYIAACMPPTVIGLGARLELIKNGGARRTLAAEEFIGSPLETAREPGEILLAIQLPAIQAKAGSAYKKWGLVTDALPVIGVCAFIRLDRSGACDTARFAVGGLASGPRRSPAAEAALKGVKGGDNGGIAAAAQAAADQIETQTDLWADKAYRKQLIKALGAEATGAAFTRAG
jgi:aerobic carbon-monoxide dehydrogenase medium subunit